MKARIRVNSNTVVTGFDPNSIKDWIAANPVLFAGGAIAIYILLTQLKIK